MRVSASFHPNGQTSRPWIALRTSWVSVAMRAVPPGFRSRSVIVEGEDPQAMTSSSMTHRPRANACRASRESSALT